METLPLIEYTPEGIAILALFILLFVLRNQTKAPQQFSRDILSELKLMNDNHLHSIEQAVNNASSSLAGTIHDDNMKIIELLGEIKGNLRK